ncbi:MAG: membrane protein insertase YidC, partial [Ancrocorticia sp.]|nr:membrane protein insertase YidC [Ancrocorticia sp.]
AETLAQEEAAAAGGQRQQPMSKERAKKAGLEKNVVESPAEVEEEDIDPSEVRGKDGLTDAERARKRYERRQAERARSKAKQEQRKKKAQQNNKKRNF